MVELYYEFERYALVVPAWLQIVIGGYLGIVLTSWGIEKVRERRGLGLAIVSIVLGLALAVRAFSMLVTAVGL